MITLNRKGIALPGLLAVLAALAVGAIAGWHFARWRRSAPAIPTPYSAVLLSNGHVYFGKLEGLGTRFPVMTDVYYVQSGVNPDTKQPTNVLLKRGSEWHAPDRMILNANQIVLVEPVGITSKVSDLIGQLKDKQK